MPLKPTDNEYAPYYAKYISLVTEGDILAAMEQQPDEVSRIASAFPAGREQHRYEKGKWSVREVLGHLLDSERVFGFRAFCFSRGEKAPLPSFDENMYVERSHYDEAPLAELVAAFHALRKSNIAFLRRLEENQWREIGTASGYPVSVRALAWIMVGHARHHLNVLRDRYIDKTSPFPYI